MVSGFTSLGNKRTERIWHEQYVKRIDRRVQRVARRKLELIHTAKDVEDFRIPPGNPWSGCRVIAADSTAFV